MVTVKLLWTCKYISLISNVVWLTPSSRVVMLVSYYDSRGVIFSSRLGLFWPSYGWCRSLSVHFLWNLSDEETIACPPRTKWRSKFIHVKFFTYAQRHAHTSLQYNLWKLIYVQLLLLSHGAATNQWWFHWQTNKRRVCYTLQITTSLPNFPILYNISPCDHMKSQLNGNLLTPGWSHLVSFPP